jgi:hypothetical protein
MNVLATYPTVEIQRTRWQHGKTSWEAAVAHGFSELKSIRYAKAIFNVA